VEQPAEVEEGQDMNNARFFISHSHADRDVAMVLDQVLRKHRIETFVNRGCVEAGEILPDRLAEGIAWCNRFLLLWSINAARSTWVSEQWDQAYGQQKQILPYRLDSCPLPDVLDGPIYIDVEDQWAGPGKLHAAVFGETIDHLQLFEGAWCATLTIEGASEATHHLDLYANGQILGKGMVSPSGKLANLMRRVEMAHLLNIQFPLRGEWTYHDRSQILALDFTCEGLGMSKREVIQIPTTGEKLHLLEGKDKIGRTWIIERLS
jgi:hypothetical protein